MCELLVRTVDKVNVCPYIDANHSTKRGDVIVIFEDGHEWGRAEINAPHWTIVKVPGVPRELATGFLAKEIDDDWQRPSNVLQARAFSYDLAAAPTDYASLMQAMIPKAKLSDPNVMD